MAAWNFLTNEAAPGIAASSEAVRMVFDLSLKLQGERFDRTDCSAADNPFWSSSKRRKVMNLGSQVHAASCCPFTAPQ